MTKVKVAEAKIVRVGYRDNLRSVFIHKTILDRYSLLPTVAKVLEGIVKDWLIPPLDPLLDENQFGCRPGRSTTHTLIAVLHKWMEILDKRGSVRAVFIDYRKVFDIVNHNTLLGKLKKYNIPHCLFKWFGSYLSHRCQRVKVGQLFPLTLCGGMPQGSPLGPLS